MELDPNMHTDLPELENAAEDELDELKHLVSPESVFGPIDGRNIQTPFATRCLFYRYNKIYGELGRRPTPIIGRRGSGKTAFLLSLKANSEYRFIAEQRTHRYFEQYTNSIQGLVSRATEFVEAAAEIWCTVFWVGLMIEIRSHGFGDNEHFAPAAQYLESLGIGRERKMDSGISKLLAHISKVVAPEADSFQSASKQHLDSPELAKAKDATITFLKKSRLRAILLIDSLEDYNLKQRVVRKSLAGLLKAIPEFNSEQGKGRLEVRLCLPAELYPVFRKISSNSLKDFGHKIILRWHPGELIQIAASRLKLFYLLYDPEFYQSIRQFDVSNRKDAETMLRKVLPDKITNLCGIPEDSLSYILRHTQLLPRHLLLYLNRIFRENNRTAGASSCHVWRRVSAEAVVKGITESESDICDEIFAGHCYIYPRAEKLVESILKILPPTFTYGELHQCYNEHIAGRDLTGGLDELTTVLTDLGALGVWDEDKHGYVYARFTYILPHRLSISSQDRLCVHPVFMEKFGVGPRWRRDLRSEETTDTFIKARTIKPVYPRGNNPDAEELTDLVSIGA